jgi:acyl carrier protein
MLTSLAEQYLSGKGSADRVALASLPHSSDSQPDRAFILNTLGNLWLSGIDPDWASVHRNERRCRITLPTYPFERQRYWLNPKPRSETVRYDLGKSGAGSSVDGISSSREADVEEDASASTRPSLGAEYVAPTNSTEQKIVEIWEGLLGTHPIGIHDEFLRLGGNSLLAIRVAADLREAFQIDFPLEALLKSATVAEIAIFVEDTLLTMIEGMDEAPSELENK